MFHVICTQLLQLRTSDDYTVFLLDPHFDSRMSQHLLILKGFVLGLVHCTAFHKDMNNSLYNV